MSMQSKMFNAAFKIVLLLALLMCPGSVVSLTYYVTQHPHDPCPRDYDNCTTLSDFAMTSDSENTSLIFSTGYHSLDRYMTISDVSSLILTSEYYFYENDTDLRPTIKCQPSVRIAFFSIVHVHIRGLDFSGCIECRISDVTNLVIDNVNSQSVFNEQASALIVNQSNVYVIESSFTRFRGSIWESSVIQHRARLENASVGGVIIAIMSEIHISDCVFQSNSADMGGALYIESSINVTITKTSFADHNTTTFGGVLFVDGGHVFISDTSFVNNILSHSDPKNVTRGGVIQAFGSQVVIHYSNFSLNFAYMGAVIESRDSFVEFCNTNFSNNTAKLNGGVGLFKRCTIVIYQSFFRANIAEEKNGGALYIDHSNLTVEYSSFHFNEANNLGGVAKISKSSVHIKGSDFGENRVYSRGGVLYLSNKNNVLLSSSTFYGNKAYTGGAFSVNTGSTLRLSDSVSFLNNSAYYGGAIQVQYGTLTCACKLSVIKNTASWGVITFLQSTGHINGTVLFKNNSGSLLAFGSEITLASKALFRSNSQLVPGTREGGGITSILSAITIKGRCTFTNNRALNGGGVLATSSRIEIFDKFTVSNNIANDTGGGMYLYHSNVIVNGGSVSISGNQAHFKGGGIHLVSSLIIVVEKYQTEGSISFENNEAKLGGGVCMEESSKLYNTVTMEHRVVSFRDNEAELGGAIYVSDETNNGTCTSSENNITPTFDSDCFFQSVPFTKSDNEKIKYKIIEKIVSFSGNSANNSGDVLYGGLLDRCTIDVFDKKAYIKILYSSQPHFVDELLNFTSSSAVRVCFCKDKTSEVDCSFQPDAVNVKRGENFTLHVAAVDHVNHTLSDVTIHSYLTHKDGRLGKGMKSQVATSLKCTTLTYRAYTVLDHENLTMYPEGPCKDAEKSRRQIQINFLPCTCPVGFEESQTSLYTCKCVCHHLLENIVSNCDSSTHLIYRKGDFWMTPFNTSGTTSFFVFQYCPFDHCLPATVNVSINLTVRDGVDAQCNHNRSGILCSTCTPGLSLSLGSSRCIDCPRYWPALTVTLTLSAFITGIILASVVLMLNLTVAAGTLNAVVFYANVVAANKSILSAFQERNILTVLLAWLNLDLGLDVCYYKGLETYAKTWIDFLFCFYINLIVISVILVCKYSDRFAAFIGKRNPVATLATLILFSYAKLLQNIITVVSFAVLQYPDNSSTIVWRPDASVTYLNGKHIPLFMMALAVLVVGIMYTIVLFSWQWLLPLSRFKLFKWVQNTKISSFMDAYHAPYTPRKRYWTGLLLIARVILYTVSAVNVSGEPGINLLSVIIVVASLFILKFKLYKKWTIDFLETGVYVNLIMLCAGKFYILNNKSDDHVVLESISASVVVFMFICVLLHHVISNAPIKICIRWVLNHFRSAKRESFNLSSPLLQNEFAENINSSRPNPVTFSVIDITRPTLSDNQRRDEEEESNTY